MWADVTRSNVREGIGQIPTRNTLSADIYHHAVKCALVKDGWVILAEDYALTYGSDRVYADIAAEKAIALRFGNTPNLRSHNHANPLIMQIPKRCPYASPDPRVLLKALFALAWRESEPWDLYESSLMEIG